MACRFFFLLFVLFGLLNAEEYPLTFARLGTPLFESSQKLSAFSDIDSLETEVQKFQTELSLAMKDGQKVDNIKDKKAIKEYLLRLRKLQKHYEYLLHLIEQEIQKAIEKQEYNKFIKLTSHELNGLLDKKNIKNQAIAFYKKNREIKKSKLLEKKMHNDALFEATTQEFYNEIIESTYSSNDKTPHAKKSVFIYTKRVKNSIQIFFSNSNPYDVTLSVKGRYKNFQESPDTTHEFVVKAKSNYPFTTLKMTKGESSYSFSYSWIIGNKDAVHNDAYLYRFPYAAKTAHIISQGYNGKYTHRGNSRYALDFAMKEGTKIYAARGGIVVRTKSDSNIGGYDKKFSKYGNYITIAHNDGTLATYYHLKRHGVLVKIGERVERGFPIGYSGNTGYTSGPHLHFAVFSAKSARATESIAVKFEDEKGIVAVPTQGRAYVAK